MEGTGLITIESNKGQPCPLKAIICQEGYCQDCNIYLKIMESDKVESSKWFNPYQGCALDNNFAAKKVKVWCFDFDNTLCFTKGTDYDKSKPNYEAIKKVNKLYDKGNCIKIFTGRGVVSGINQRSLTEAQLEKWGVKYHELIMGKPSFDIFIDDLAYNARDWMSDNIPDIYLKE